MSVNRAFSFNTMVASAFHALEFDYPLLAGAYMAAARLMQPDSCHALDDGLVLAPGVAVDLSLGSRQADSARGTVPRILDTEILATR